MEGVTISPTFQVVIPRSVRELLNLKAGQQVQVIAYIDRIEFGRRLTPRLPQTRWVFTNLFRGSQLICTS